jgi:hypothetical protein
MRKKRNRRLNRWSWLFASPALAVLLVTVIQFAFSNLGYAQADKQTRTQMIELNKEALKAMDAREFDRSKELLFNAIALGKEANLHSDNMMARSYLHLGVIWFVGFQDSHKAMHYFGMAKGIRADIPFTPALATPELLRLFAESPITKEDAPEPTVAPTAPPKVVTPPSPEPALAQPEIPLTAGPPVGAKPEEISESSEPTAPATIPLLCTVPTEVKAGQALSLRCGIQPGQAVARVLINYRLPGTEQFQSIPMSQNSEGWYVGQIPGQMIQGKGFQLYFSALDSRDTVLASNGRADSPNAIVVRQGKGERRFIRDEDPMAKLRQEVEDEEYEAGLHRRRKGALWVSVGGGLAWGYSSGGKLEWNRSVNSVSPITTNVGTAQIVPEVGYLLLDKFALALQLRYELIAQQQLKGVSAPNSVVLSGMNPKKSALAALARAIYYIDLGSGNWQLSVSGDLGAGTIRFPIKPRFNCIMSGNDCKTDEEGIPEPQIERTVFRTDTIKGGSLLFGGGAGVIYHLNRHFALAVEGRMLGAAPDFGFLFEGQLALQVAFGGSGPEASTYDPELDQSDTSSEPPLSE